MGTIPSGEVFDMSTLEILLSDCWDQLGTQGIGGMCSEKLVGRMENAKWDPPTLTFDIERHGGLTLGSTRSDIQRWEVNLCTATTDLKKVVYRQTVPRQSKLDVKPLAGKISQLIRNNRDDPVVSWSENRSQVRVRIGKVKGLEADSAKKRTLENRRKRFHEALRSILEPMGWQYIGSAGGPRFQKKK